MGALLALGATVGVAQFQRGGGRGGFRNVANEDSGSFIRIEGGLVVDENSIRTARETMSHSTGTPNWENPRGFEKDVFTYARIIFKSGPGAARVPGGPRFGWWVDYPDADLNFSYRLQQMTSTKVDPDCRVLWLTDPALTDYPLITMEHAGYMELENQEVDALGKYLRNGGALFVNDFWSTRDWEGFEAVMKRVLPGRGWVDLPLTHPIFHSVFELKGPLQALQVPTMQFWNIGVNPGDIRTPLQWMDRGVGSEPLHVRAWLDDQQRIMVIAIHNSDLTDGWEREGENHAYFQTFSEKISYPLGINIIFYVMTH